MKIEKITLKNFKSFGPLTNTWDNTIDSFSNINMLFGYNNSGKSNLIKFLQLVFQSKGRLSKITVEEEVIERRENSPFWKGHIDNAQYIFHKNKRDIPVDFEIVIRISDADIKKSEYSHYKKLNAIYLKMKTGNRAVKEDYKLILKGQIKKLDDFDTAEIIINEGKLNGHEIYSIDSKGKFIYFQNAPTGKTNDLKSDGTAFENLLAIFEDSTLFLDNNRYLDNPRLPDFEGPIALTPGNYKNWLYSQYINPKTNHIFEELKEFIKNNKITTNGKDESSFKEVEGFSLFPNFNPEFADVNGQKELMFRIDGKRLPLSSFGTGLHQILYILTVIIISKAKWILIEELELNLSPRYQRALFHILKNLIDTGRINQVFFTTHSKSFTFRKDFSIYEISMNSSGSSKATKVNQTRANKYFEKRID